MAERGYLTTNLLHFGRLLRELGIRVSADQISSLAQGLTTLDIMHRADFYYAARCFFVRDPEQIPLFDQAFDLFWMGQTEWMIEFNTARRFRDSEQDTLTLPDEQITRIDRPRLDTPTEQRPAFDESRAALTYSPIEALRYKDFTDFTLEEIEAAQQLIEKLAWRIENHLTRRRIHAAGRAAYLDLNRSIRSRSGGEIIKLAWQQRKRKPRPLIVLCDISGSMEAYTRMLLRFMYALVQTNWQIKTFVFGTRLTPITVALRHKDLDQVLDQVSNLVLDWSGGTRIGETLKTFNYEWSRRVLGRGAVALIISDGWDRGNQGLLAREISRLQRSVSRLIWLNPLLGAPNYEPLVRGIQTILPYVDDFLPAHNLASLESVATHLGKLNDSTHGSGG